MEDLVNWRKFNTDIYSNEKQLDNVLETLENDDEKWIDLRPYMIEFPPKVTRFT